MKMGAAPRPPESELPEVPWRAREGFVIAFLALASDGVLVLFATLGLKDTESLFFFAVVAQSATLGVWVLLWIKIRYGLGWEALGLRRRTGNLGFGLMAGVVGYVAVVFGVAPIARLIGETISDRAVEPPPHEILQRADGVLEMVIAGLAAVVLAPIAEELFFRGFLYQALRRWRGILPGALLSALIFMVPHLDPRRMFDTVFVTYPIIFSLGVLLAFVYERRGSVVAPMLAHAVFNLINVTVSFAAQQP